MCQHHICRARGRTLEVGRYWTTPEAPYQPLLSYHIQLEEGERTLPLRLDTLRGHFNEIPLSVWWWYNKHFTCHLCALISLEMPALTVYSYSLWFSTKRSIIGPWFCQQSQPWIPCHMTIWKVTLIPSKGIAMNKSTAWNCSLSVPCIIKVLGTLWCHLSKN